MSTILFIQILSLQNNIFKLIKKRCLVVIMSIFYNILYWIIYREVDRQTAIYKAE